MNLEDHIKDLTPELQEKARACGSLGELLALAKDEKVPLPDEVLAAIAGGDDDDDSVGCGYSAHCPKCHSFDLDVDKSEIMIGIINYHCNNCGYEWSEATD